MSTLFISDLHLCGQRPQLVALFLQFLQQRAIHANALYILGDLFEYWIGDEALARNDIAPAIRGMRALTDADVPLYVMHGNRDFLLGPAFAQATGATLIEDPTVIDLYGTRTILAHGDAFCTNDKEFMNFRNMVRNPDWQQQVLAKSAEERIALASEYRGYSKTSTANKKPEIMDVTEDAIVACLRTCNARHMIHGHTHRPARHDFIVDGQAATRIVLKDWYEDGGVLVCDATGCNAETLSLEN